MSQTNSPTGAAPQPTAAKSAPATQPKAAAGGLQVIGDYGQPVDWWFAYKVSAESQPAGSMKGTEYLYYDAEAAKAKAPLKLSASKMDQPQGALFDTLSQLYSATPAQSTGLAWFFYNDENPDDPSGYKNPVNGVAFKPADVVGARGHTKGALAVDFATDTAFWLIHSAPKFAWPERFNYPETAVKEAQTLLCVTLPDAATALTIARQMFHCQEPNVFAASPLPSAAMKNPDASSLVSLMNNEIATPPAEPGKVAPPPDFLKAIVPFKSRGGQAFQAIAKNKQWGQAQTPKWDFYNDLVGKVLQENLDVETWEHYATPLPQDHDSNHRVVGMKSVDLSALGYKVSWSEEDDHAKLAVSATTESVHWVCVGDINFTRSMEERGGGTLAFICDPLWQALSEVLIAPADPTAKAQGTATAKPAAKT